MNIEHTIPKRVFWSHLKSQPFSAIKAFVTNASHWMHTIYALVFKRIAAVVATSWHRHLLHFFSAIRIHKHKVYCSHKIFRWTTWKRMKRSFFLQMPARESEWKTIQIYMHKMCICCYSLLIETEEKKIFFICEWLLCEFVCSKCFYGIEWKSLQHFIKIKRT